MHVLCMHVPRFGKPDSMQEIDEPWIVVDPQPVKLGSEETVVGNEQCNYTFQPFLVLLPFAFFAVPMTHRFCAEC